MNPLNTLLQTQPLIFLHLVSAVGALLLGGWILWRPKGSVNHRVLGRVWVVLMASTTLSSAFISGGRMPNIGGFSPIHAFTVLVAVMLPRGIWQIRAGQVQAHRKTMRGLYIGSCVIAGLFTLLPGRFLGQWLWHQTLGLV